MELRRQIGSWSLICEPDIQSYLLPKYDFNFGDEIFFKGGGCNILIRFLYRDLRVFKNNLKLKCRNIFNKWGILKENFWHGNYSNQI